MAGGPLSGILGGIIGGDQANLGTGILGNMNTAMTNNAGTLLGLGAGLMSGDWGVAAQGAAQGMQADQRTRLLKLKEAEEEQKKVAYKQLAQSLGKPELAAMPEVLNSLALDRYKTKGHQLVGSAETGYAWVQEGGQLPDYLTKGTGPKATDDQRELNQINQERQARGLGPLYMEDFLAQKNKGVVVNNLPAQVEKTEEVERAKLNAKYLSDLSAQSGTIARRSADLDFLGRVVSKTNTGTGADTRATLDGIGKSLGMSPGTLKTQADAIKAVTNRVAPTLRAEGSGSQSDAELAGFLAALPNLTASPEGNQLITSTLQRAAKLDRERTKIASQFSSGRISATEARQKIAELDEQSIYASEEEKKIIDNAMGFAPLSGGEKGAKGWKILGWE